VLAQADAAARGLLEQRLIPVEQLFGLVDDFPLMMIAGRYVVLDVQVFPEAVFFGQLDFAGRILKSAL
jgi:hypothetical protein